MSNYSGPITVVTFVSTVNPLDRFAITFHTAVEDLDSIEKIVNRYAEDGYKPQLDCVRRWYMIDGSIVERENKPGPAGFRTRSAFLKA